MWLKKLYRRGNGTVLTAKLGEHVLGNVLASEVPVELQPAARVTLPGCVFELSDSQGRSHRYDLSSVVAECGDVTAFFSIRVSPSFAVEADCLLSKESARLPDLAQPDVKGIRFQPFYLPECKGDPSELVGRGLFFRGLHYPGLVTPGNVSLLSLCDACHKSFRLQSFHAGFGNVIYFYCDRGTHTLIADANLPGAPPLLGDASPEEVKKFEARLPACCSCGGAFRHGNSFRCPHCGVPYIDFEKNPADRKAEYYGNVLYGAQPQVLK